MYVGAKVYIIWADGPLAKTVHVLKKPKAHNPEPGSGLQHTKGMMYKRTNLLELFKGLAHVGKLSVRQVRPNTEPTSPAPTQRDQVLIQ